MILDMMKVKNLIALSMLGVDVIVVIVLHIYMIWWIAGGFDFKT